MFGSPGLDSSAVLTRSEGAHSSRARQVQMSDLGVRIPLALQIPSGFDCMGVRQGVNELLRHKWGKPICFILLAIPLITVLNDIRIELLFPGQGFGPEPNEELTDRMGIWSLRLLYVTLAISSISRLLRIPTLIRYRRMAGLWCFAMVALHFTCYFGLLAEANVMAVIEDFVKRPYIIAGSVALASLIPLAVTSTRGWQIRLGVNWRRLHMLVYVAAIAAWIHLLWLEKASFMESAIYGAILAVLSIERIVFRLRRQRASS